MSTRVPLRLTLVPKRCLLRSVTQPSSPGGHSMYEISRPASYQQTQQNTESVKYQHKMAPVALKRSTEPVWHEDEEAENKALLEQGKPLPVMASDSFAEKVIKEVSFGLADRLFATIPDQKALAGNLDTANWDYVGFGIPLSFDAPDPLFLWRVRLTLNMFIPGMGGQQAYTSAGKPVARLLDPSTNISSTAPVSGELGLDAAKFTKLFAPVIADVLNANFKISFKPTRYCRKVETSGMGTPTCHWRVADPTIVPSFHPLVVAQVPRGRRLAIKAELHIEIRKQVAGIFHQVYAISDPDLSIYYVHPPGASTFESINPKLPQNMIDYLLSEGVDFGPPPEMNFEEVFTQGLPEAPANQPLWTIDSQPVFTQPPPEAPVDQPQGMLGKAPPLVPSDQPPQAGVFPSAPPEAPAGEPPAGVLHEPPPAAPADQSQKRQLGRLLPWLRNLRRHS